MLLCSLCPFWAPASSCHTVIRSRFSFNFCEMGGSDGYSNMAASCDVTSRRGSWSCRSMWPLKAKVLSKCRQSTTLLFCVTTQKTRIINATDIEISNPTQRCVIWFERYSLLYSEYSNFRFRRNASIWRQKPKDCNPHIFHISQVCVSVWVLRPIHT